MKLPCSSSSPNTNTTVSEHRTSTWVSPKSRDSFPGYLRIGLQSITRVRWWSTSTALDGVQGIWASKSMQRCGRKPRWTKETTKGTTKICVKYVYIVFYIWHILTSYVVLWAILCWCDMRQYENCKSNVTDFMFHLSYPWYNINICLCNKRNMVYGV